MGWTALVLGWDTGLTLLAPLIAILMALLTHRVLPSLSLGVVVAAIVSHSGRVWPDTLLSLGTCFLGQDCEAASRGALGGVAAYVGEAVLDTDNLTIAVFTLGVAAMVGVMGASGATRALVRVVERRAKGPRGAMVASWLAGFVVFFDDYANCLVVGSSMGPVCDRYGVSRAKLAYIVDSTAAPVASLAVVGTWVGYEVGLLEQALAASGQGEGGGFTLFLEALPYRFYGIFALALVGILSWTGRDYGPMWTVEHEARTHRLRTPVEPVDGAGMAGWLAVMPVLLLVEVTFARMFQTGVSALVIPWQQAQLFQILGDADAFGSMLWGAAAGWSSALVIGAAAGSLPGAAAWRASLQGARGVLEALVVLYMAWTLGNAIGDSGAREFLLLALGDWFPVWLLPGVVFSLAGGVAFATGTSFGTMSILVPLAVPLAVGMSAGVGSLVAATTAAVLAGACLGDHASPISDTTVLSATGAGADLVTHVRTQLPYALTAGAVSLVLGYLPAGLGLSPWVSIVLGLGVLVGVVRTLGRSTSPVSAH